MIEHGSNPRMADGASHRLFSCEKKEKRKDGEREKELDGPDNASSFSTRERTSHARWRLTWYRANTVFAAKIRTIKHGRMIPGSFREIFLTTDNAEVTPRPIAIQHPAESHHRLPPASASPLRRAPRREESRRVDPRDERRKRSVVRSSEKRDCESA